MSISKVAIITGASSGIGRSTAIALSAAGWNVTLTARRIEELNESIGLCPHSENCLAIAGDITDEEFVKGLFQKTVDRFGRLDMLFNNAGASSKATPIEDMELSTLLHVHKVNFIAPFLCTREAVRTFKKQDPVGGRIINNGSLAAHAPRPDTIPYTTSKHAISGLTKATSLDGRKYNITCTQIDIGNAATVMAAGSAIGATQPDGRVVPEATFDPQHVADAIVHISGLPNDVTVLNINIMATTMPFVGRG